MDMLVKDLYTSGISGVKCGLSIRFGKGDWNLFAYPCELFDGYDITDSAESFPDDWYEKWSHNWYEGYPEISKAFGRKPKYRRVCEGNNDVFGYGYVVYYDDQSLIYLGSYSDEVMTEGVDEDDPELYIYSVMESLDEHCRYEKILSAGFPEKCIDWFAPTMDV